MHVTDATMKTALFDRDITSESGRNHCIGNCYDGNFPRLDGMSNAMGIMIPIDCLNYLRPRSLILSILAVSILFSLSPDEREIAIILPVILLHMHKALL